MTTINKLIILTLIVFGFVYGAAAQQTNSQFDKSQEVSETDGIPVIIKHLPDWENARNGATLITKADELPKIFGDRAIFDLIDFSGGTEAVAADYPAGKLLLIEFNTPQASIETDKSVKQRIAQISSNPPIFYRRIGNYNVFLFDGTDDSAANDLFDQIKYEKTVQWLDERPFIVQRAERFVVQKTSNVVLSTALAILLGIGLAVGTGIGIGLIFFRFRENRRLTTKSFSDAGGMTRLNLDEMTTDIAPNRLLGK